MKVLNIYAAALAALVGAVVLIGGISDKDALSIGLAHVCGFCGC
jgi:hypothetical protein